MKMKSLAIAVVGLLSAGVMSHASAQVVSIGTGQVPGASGGEVVLSVQFDPQGAVVGGFNTVYSFASIDGITGAPTSSSGLCVVDAPSATVSIARFDPMLVGLGAETLCNLTFNVPAASAVGSYAIPHDPSAASTAFSDLTGNLMAGTVLDGTINIVDQGPPTITFDETAVALPGGVFGTTQTGTIAVTVTPGGGNVSTDTASYTCTAPAGFTVSPLTGGPIDNSGTLADLTVSAVLTSAAQSGNVECTATNTSGSEVDFTIAVSAPAGTEAAPVLGANPASGTTITFPNSVVGSTANTGITFTPTGGAGTLSATLNCSSDIFTVAPADMTFAVGSAAQSITASCAVTAAEQVGTIDCVGTDGSGDVSFSYDATCPAGVEISAPLYVPASSLWSKLAMFGIFAGLGLAVLGFRRNH